MLFMPVCVDLLFASIAPRLHMLYVSRRTVEPGGVFSGRTLVSYEPCFCNQLCQLSGSWLFAERFVIDSSFKTSHIAVKWFGMILLRINFSESVDRLMVNFWLHSSYFRRVATSATSISHRASHSACLFRASRASSPLSTSLRAGIVPTYCQVNLSKEGDYLRLHPNHFL